MKDSKSQKSHKMKKQELRAKKEKARAEARRTPAQPVIYVLKAKVRNLAVAIEEAFEGKKFPYSETKIHNILAAIKDHKSKSFLKEIFLHFANLKIDFADKLPRGQLSPIDALANLACYRNYALRPVQDWKPNSHNLHRMVAHFARHLYAKYHIPAFMNQVWYGNTQHQQWFIHVGQGQNIRTAPGVPPLTKKEAHLMMQAPNDLTVLQAIRYGQILNIGGDELFVRKTMRTRIAVDFNNNEFWMSVFRWLLQNPMLDAEHYAPIIDFIYNQKYVPCRVDTFGHMVAAQPNLSMKGRDPETTLRQVEAWHKQIGKERKGNFGQWASTGIKGFYHKSDRDNTVYMIQEICTQKELIAEGRTMRHCVGSYAGSCAQGRISIWKFEVVNMEGIDKRLTIEVDNHDRRISQARGKFNAIASSSDKYWLNKWANEAGLTLSRYMI